MFGHKAKTYAGEVTVFNADGSSVTYPIKQCCHCGEHYTVEPAGVPRMVYKCRKCSGWICGPECETCVPYEKKILAISEDILRKA